MSRKSAAGRKLFVLVEKKRKEKKRKEKKRKEKKRKEKKGRTDRKSLALLSGLETQERSADLPLSSSGGSGLCHSDGEESSPSPTRARESRVCVCVCARVLCLIVHWEEGGEGRGGCCSITRNASTAAVCARVCVWHWWMRQWKDGQMLGRI